MIFSDNKWFVDNLKSVEATETDAKKCQDIIDSLNITNVIYSSINLETGYGIINYIDNNEFKQYRIRP
jgi:hypothetical protein